MFKIDSIWRVDRNLLVLKIIGTVKLNHIEYIDKQIEAIMINMMVTIILQAQKHNGKVLDTVPNIPKYKDNLTVCSSIIFDTPEHLEEFKNKCYKFFNQG